LAEDRHPPATSTHFALDLQANAKIIARLEKLLRWHEQMWELPTLGCKAFIEAAYEILQFKLPALDVDYLQYFREQP